MKNFAWLGVVVIYCIGCGNHGPALKPVIITEQTPHDTDDPAIWVNTAEPSKSMIIGTDKHKSGGLYAFDLQGKIIKGKTVAPLGYPNNVDIAYGLQLQGKPTDIAVVTEHDAQRIRVFSLPDLLPIDNGGFPAFAGEKQRGPMGIAVYTSPLDHAMYAIVSRKSGPAEGYLWQYKLSGDSSGHVKGEMVRKFGKYSGKKEIESVSVDNELGFIYYSDENFGVHKYYADPAKGNNELALFGRDDFKEDIEGISIYKTAGNRGYILISNQQANQFMVYPREGTAGEPNSHKLIKAINFSTKLSDGSDVTNMNLGEKFPRGLFVAMSEPRVFHYYNWLDIEKALRAP